MSLPISTCLNDLSNEDILDIAWEPEFLDQATPLERLLVHRLAERCEALANARDECRRLLDTRWSLC